MKQLKLKCAFSVATISILLSAYPGFSQLISTAQKLAVRSTAQNMAVRYTAQKVAITIAGTSTLHDWEMKSDKGQSQASFVVDNNKITSVPGLSFSVPATSLKSGKSLMDNNTYKALKTDVNKSIDFVLTSASITPVDAATYLIKSAGRLTIAGTTRETDIVATAKINTDDNSITVAGVKKFKMTDYNVKPPTVLMGTIKTGNDISISYHLIFKK